MIYQHFLHSGSACSLSRWLLMAQKLSLDEVRPVYFPFFLSLFRSIWKTKAWPKVRRLVPVVSYKSFVASALTFRGTETGTELYSSA